MSDEIREGKQRSNKMLQTSGSSNFSHLIEPASSSSASVRQQPSSSTLMPIDSSSIDSDSVTVSGEKINEIKETKEKKSTQTSFGEMVVGGIAGFIGRTIFTGLLELAFSSKTAPLHPVLLAAQEGNLEQLKKLVGENPSVVTLKDSNGATPLLLAMSRNQPATALWLLQQGGAVEDRATALLLAAETGQITILQWLLKVGKIDPKGVVTSEVGLSTIFFTAARCGHLKIIEWLLQENFFKTTESNNLGMTVLLVAVYYGKLEIVQWLLQKDPSQILLRNNEGKTALLIAAEKGFLPIVKWLLLNKFSKISENDRHGNTAFILAADKHNVTTMQWLLMEGGSDIMETSKVNTTAFSRSVINRDLEIMSWLLREGGNKLVEQMNTLNPIILDLLMQKKSPASIWFGLYQAFQSKKIVTQIAALKILLEYCMENSENFLQSKSSSSLLAKCTTELLLQLGYDKLLTHPDIDPKILAHLFTVGFLAIQPELIAIGNLTIQRKLPENQYLLRFELSHCYWTELKINLFKTFLEEHAKIITHLKISDGVFNDDSWKILIKSVSKLPLAHLDLSGNQINDVQLVALAQEVMKISTLTELVLNKNRISYRGFRDFLQEIRKHPRLERLLLRENRIFFKDREIFDRDIGPLLREQGHSLQQVDISTNYLLSAPHDANRLIALGWLLRATKLTAGEFAEAEWIREKSSPRIDCTVLCLAIQGVQRDFEIPISAMDALNSYRTAQNIRSDSLVLQDLQNGLTHNLRRHPELKAIRLSTLEAKAVKEQKQLCKQMLFFHPNEPLKAYLAAHPQLRSNRLTSADSFLCRLCPDQTITTQEWRVYFLSDRKHTHALLGWEGIYSYGQRVLKVAHLTFQIKKNPGFLGKLSSTKELVIDYHHKFEEVESIEKFCEDYDVAVFKATKKSVKVMEAKVESQIKDMPGKYKTIISSSSNSAELSPEDQQKVVTNCQKWALERIEKCLGLPNQHLQGKMKPLPSWTVQALKGMAHSIIIDQDRPADSKQSENGGCIVM